MSMTLLYRRFFSLLEIDCRTRPMGTMWSWEELPLLLWEKESQPQRLACVRHSEHSWGRRCAPSISSVHEALLPHSFLLSQLSFPCGPFGSDSVSVKILDTLCICMAAVLQERRGGKISSPVTVSVHFT